jgi:hypothetical protein
MRQATDASHPLHTIYTPNGDPYLSIIDEETIIKVQLHSYDDITKRGVFLTIDKKAIPQLINILEKVING